MTAKASVIIDAYPLEVKEEPEASDFEPVAELAAEPQSAPRAPQTCCVLDQYDMCAVGGVVLGVFLLGVAVGGFAFSSKVVEIVEVAPL